MPLAPGTWLAHYEILGHLGSGGMGDVYHARDNKFQREVALKVLPEHFARDPERIARAIWIERCKRQKLYHAKYKAKAHRTAIRRLARGGEGGEGQGKGL